jgi:SAM-dependent methyltransferase
MSSRFSGRVTGSAVAERDPALSDRATAVQDLALALAAAGRDGGQAHAHPGVAGAGCAGIVLLPLAEPMIDGWVERTQLPRNVWTRLQRAFSGAVVDLGCGSEGSNVDPGSAVRIADAAPALVVRLDKRQFPRPGHREVHLVADLESPLPLADATFDAVVCNHVLEHVRDPGLVMSEVSRVLKIGGLLVVAVPNGASVSDRLFRCYYGLFHKRSDRDWDGHVQRFRHEDFLALLRQQAFEILHFEDLHETYSWLGKHRLVQGAMFGVNRALRRWWPQPFGYGWYVIAAKW